MDFLTVLSYVLAVVETATLLGALVFATRAMHENKLKRKQGKKGAKSAEEIDQNVGGYKRIAGIFLFVYLILNVLRNFGGIQQ